uniref:glycoside hydrolase family 2 TIM barrel-domain containing protein n=1 Tax=Alistipes sp. TaxID=1872444 RepID=UPI004057B3AC
MKRVILLLCALVALCSAVAQRVYRTEFSVFDLREAALRNDHSHTEHFIRYAPKTIEVVGKVEVVGQTINIPTSWSDYNLYIHIQNTIKAYDLVVNELLVASVDDSYTPADFLLSPYLRQGNNEVLLLLRRSETIQLNAGGESNLVKQFHGSYIFAQHRKHIYDYDARIVQSKDSKNYLLELAVAVRNDFNFEEVVQVGYDIYSPDNKLIDYAVRDITVGGRSIDTLKISTALGDISRNLWSSANPKLYRITLYTKRDGKPREYISFRLGAGVSTFTDGKILRNGKPLTIKSARYNARTSYREALESIKALKAKGVNTLCPNNPQPEWFYDICDGLGMYVIERANINPVEHSENRKVGGTPSNEPALVGEYIARVKTMYYRTRNHSCIIAYALGGDKAGNGYNMYKAYQWLKGVEKERAIICTSADGEWNSDIQIDN